MLRENHLYVEPALELPNVQEKPRLQFPVQVFDQLPQILKEGCKLFPHGAERDIALIGCLAVLSGCLPSVFGKYDHKSVGTNLFFFIIAPASAGKGSLTWTKYLGERIHQSKRERSREARIQYEEAIKVMNRQKGKKSTNEEPPTMPKQEMLFIPANVSASAFLTALDENDGRGTLFCTEADTLSGSLQKEWGNFSDIIRSSFHHESVSLLRSTNKTFTEIGKPYISILLSGTPKQVRNLIPDAENGLFSRFGYYSFDLEPKMKNVFEASETDFEGHFLDLSQQVFEFYERLKIHSGGIEFEFTAQQKANFQTRYEGLHHDFLLRLGLDSISSIRRLAFIHFKIAMIVSVLGYMGKKTIPSRLECTDEDFQTSNLIAEVLINHAAKIFATMPDTMKAEGMKQDQLQLFKALPEEFLRGEAIELGLKMDMSAAAIDRFLTTDFFQKTRYGRYRKNT